MTHAIDRNPFSPANLQPLASPFRAGQETFQQISAGSRTAHISLQTAEGDIVTFSGLFENYQAMEARSVFSRGSSLQEATLLQQGRESLAVSVQGDLNEEELADVVRLLNDLTAIASSFFAGDHETAMTAAMNLGEMGSVSRLSATFSQQTSLHSRLVGTHPMPASLEDFGEQLRRQIPLTAENNAGEVQDYGELLRARWQQILTALENAAEESLPAPTPEPSRQKTASQMLQRLEQTMGHHPGLGAFAGPLATKAMTRAAALQPVETHAATAKAFAALQQEFAGQLHRWLTS